MPKKYRVLMSEIHSVWYTVEAKNEVPLGHKLALTDLKEGDTIIKYGHDIGKVIKSIKKGEHVHVHNVKTKKW